MRSPRTPSLLFSAVLAAGLSLLSFATVAQAAPSGSPLAFKARAPRLLGTGLEEEEPTDRLIVKYKNGATAAAVSTNGELADALRVAGNRHGLKMRYLRRTALGAHVLHLGRRMSIAQARAVAMDMRSGDARIEYAEPDRLFHPMMVPTDAYYTYQWPLFDAPAGINAQAAWDKSTGAGVIVAVVDSGFRPHADLMPNLLTGYDFINDTQVANDGDARDADATDPGDWVTTDFCGTGKTAQDSSWHGTHVAGLLAAVANNGIGMVGVAYGAKVLPVRVLGRCGGYMSDIADGLVWASGGPVSGAPVNTKPARVINLSLGGIGHCDTTMQAAVDTARARGAVLVAAAGNSNGDVAQYSPASCAGVIAVAAVARNGGKAWYSNYGAGVTISAPGGDSTDPIASLIDSGVSTPISDSYGFLFGTSMAAPYVSGTAALMLSRNPTMTPDEVTAVLLATARPFPAACDQCGAGIVDANAAVSAAGSVPTVKEVEPNNGFTTSQVLPGLPVMVKGSIASTTDGDYFRVSLPPGRALSATLRATDGGANYDLFVYNAAGRLIGSSHNGAGVSDVVVTTLNNGIVDWKLYVRVVYTAGATGSAGGYALSLRD